MFIFYFRFLPILILYFSLFYLGMNILTRVESRWLLFCVFRLFSDDSDVDGALAFSLRREFNLLLTHFHFEIPDAAPGTSFSRIHFFWRFSVARSDSFRFGMGYALVPSVQRKHTIRFFRRCSVNLLAIYKFKLKSIRKTGFQSRAPHRMLHFAIWLVFFSVRFVSAWSQSQVEREGYEKITKEREILKHLVRFFTAMQKNYEKMQ